MNFKPILVVSGEPNSIFLEIFFKSIKQKKYKRPLILICSKNILSSQMKKLNYSFKINILDQKNIFKQKLNNKKINLIDVEYKQKKAFEKISYKSRKYIGWKPILSTKESLKLTIDWYKNYSLKDKNTYLSTLGQIISYKEKKLNNLKRMDR